MVDLLCCGMEKSPGHNASFKWHILVKIYPYLNFQFRTFSRYNLYLEYFFLHICQLKGFDTSSTMGYFFFNVLRNGLTFSLQTQIFSQRVHSIWDFLIFLPLFSIPGGLFDIKPHISPIPAGGLSVKLLLKSPHPVECVLKKMKELTDKQLPRLEDTFENWT